MYVNDNNVTYVDSFGVEHIPKEVKKFIGKENVIINIYRVQAYNSIMCWYFCVGFIDFMLKGKSLLEYKINVENLKNQLSIKPFYCLH